jgi:hypothetical protein
MSGINVEKGWNIIDDEEHEIHGVTPDMIDWWWDNMEKGFVLWHPTDHKAFEWEIPPGKVGHVGAIQIAWHKVGDEPLQEIHIHWEDVSLCPISITHEHVLVACGQYDTGGKPLHMVIHQYGAASFGTRHRITVVSREPAPVEATKSRSSHTQVEAARWSEFLPELFKMWQAVTDPKINVPCCLKVKKQQNGTWAYIVENKPLIE